MLPDPGLEAAHERLVGERVVEVGPVPRHADGVGKPGQHLVQVGEQVWARQPRRAERGR